MRFGLIGVQPVIKEQEKILLSVNGSLILTQLRVRPKLTNVDKPSQVLLAALMFGCVKHLLLHRNLPAQL